jgi:1,4-dihydroxy-2-naphthoate polyprenyltransferase
MAIRPRTLPAVLGSLIVGNVLALGVEGFSLLAALVIIGCGLLLQISVNLANDCLDSRGPYPLASHGLVELTVFIFFGIVAVVGSVYLQTGVTSPEAWLLGMAMGSLNAAIILVNNVRDINIDVKTHKRTLAVRLGQGQARVFYQTLVYLPYGIIISAFLLGFLPGFAVGLSGLSLVYARSLSRRFHELSGAELNPILAQTALLSLVFSLLFSLGWYLGLS